MNLPTPGPYAADGAPAESLRTPIDDLRRRMILLARLLPFEHLRLLEADLDDLEAEAFAGPLLAGLSDSIELVASDVESALHAAWARG